jgi:hypothetical protein
MTEDAMHDHGHFSAALEWASGWLRDHPDAELLSAFDVIRSVRCVVQLFTLEVLP